MPPLKLSVTEDSEGVPARNLAKQAAIWRARAAATEKLFHRRMLLLMAGGVEAIVLLLEKLDAWGP
jgi:hypothetical protein